MRQREIDATISIIDNALEATVAQTVIVDFNIGALFQEIDGDDTVSDIPWNMVGYVVPGSIGIIVNPISVTLGVTERVALKIDDGVGGWIYTVVVLMGDIHIAFPCSFKGIGDWLIFTWLEGQWQNWNK